MVGAIAMVAPVRETLWCNGWLHKAAQTQAASAWPADLLNAREKVHLTVDADRPRRAAK